MLKKTILLIATFSLIYINGKGFAQPTGYYNSAQGLTGSALKTALRTIITSGHTSNNYNNLKSNFYYTDNIGSNKVWDMYSMNGNGTASYYFYYNNNDECGSYNSEGDCYNREHSFPKSWWGGTEEIQYADLFHLIPTDGYVNNFRGNLPYGEIASPAYTSSNGSKLGTCTFPNYSGAVFEPIDAYKGDFARNYFYMATRYNMSTWSSPMLNGDGFTSWATNMLIKWHLQDPVSTKEINRNNSVYNIQGNRNPYIDNPSWVCDVFGGNCTNGFFITSPVTSAYTGIYYTYDITYSGGTSLNCTGLPTWLTLTNISVGKARLSGTPSASQTGSSNIVLTITGVTAPPIQNFTLTVYSSGASQTIFNKTFNDNTICSDGWSTHSVTGTKSWIIQNYGSSYYAYITGYTGYSNEANQDWLISPPVNMNNFNSEILSFRTAGKFTGDALKLYYSTNYTGTGNPTSASWTEITGFSLSTGDTWTWVSSGNIDVSNISGTKVFFGIKYTSTTSAARTWELDDIKLTGSIIVNIKNAIENKTLKVFPNPSGGNINIEYELNQNSQVIIELFDITGKKVKLIHSEYQTPGFKTITSDCKNFSNGAYFIKLTAGNQISFEKIILNK